MVTFDIRTTATIMVDIEKYKVADKDHFPEEDKVFVIDNLQAAMKRLQERLTPEERAKEPEDAELRHARVLQNAVLSAVGRTLSMLQGMSSPEHPRYPEIAPIVLADTMAEHKSKLEQLMLFLQQQRQQPGHSARWQELVQQQEAARQQVIEERMEQEIVRRGEAARQSQETAHQQATERLQKEIERLEERLVSQQ